MAAVGLIVRPESYEELDTYLNVLTAATWKGLLRAHHIGGDERALVYLRRACGPELGLWDDGELAEYLVARDLEADFEPVGSRA